MVMIKIKDSLNSASNTFSGVRDSINESVKDFGSKDASTLGNEFLDCRDVKYLNC